MGRRCGAGDAVGDPHDRDRLLSATDRPVIRRPALPADPGHDQLVRMEGELRSTTSGGGNLYQLVDPADDRSYVDIDTTEDLRTGHAVVTGQARPRIEPGRVAGLSRRHRRGRPCVPRQNETVPADPASGRAGHRAGDRDPAGLSRRPTGTTAGRADRTPRLRRAPRGALGRLDPDELVGRHDLIPCTITVDPDRDVYRLTIADARSERTLPVRRSCPGPPGPRVQDRWMPAGPRHQGCRSGPDPRVRDRASRDRPASTLV